MKSNAVDFFKWILLDLEKKAALT